MALDQAKKVAATRTPVSPEELRAIMAAGHVLALGVAPSENRLGMSWAQANLETGKTKAAWNFNWGNVIATSAWDGSWQVIPGVPSSDPQEYRAYATAEDGAADYWRIIRRMDQRRQGGILAAFDAGNAHDAAAELKAAGYFGAPLAGYQKGLSALFDEYRKTFGGAPVSVAKLGTIVVIVASAAAAAYLIKQS